MSTPKRKYKVKDIDMLIAGSTLIENAIANKSFLQTKRSNWSDDFFAGIQTQIDTALEDHLGIDSAKEMRQSTQVLQSIQKQSLTDLAEVKTQIIEDFKKDAPRKTEILTQLGFNAHHATAQNGDQEALVQLLYSFKNSLTTTLKEEIVAKGTAPIILDQITTYADTLKKADVTQETFKGTKKEITAEGINFFNDIYDDIISIAKISARFYKAEPVKRDLFSFAKINKTLNAQKATPEPKAK
jgi:hypothetical protein